MDGTRRGTNPTNLVVARRIDRPEPGWFKLRQSRAGPWVPARIWWDDTEPERPRILVADVGGIPADVELVWLWGRPITEDEYDYVTAHHAWVAMAHPETLAEEVEDMNINDVYPSKYLKATDLKGKTMRLKIARIDMESVEKDGGNKPVIYFATEAGKPVTRGMVLNKTNASSLAYLFGDDTDRWTGKTVELFTTMVQFQSKMVEGLRIRPVNAAAPAKRASPVPPQPEPDDPGAFSSDVNDLDDEVPF